MWNPARQQALYEKIGYRWGHPETKRYLLNWTQRYHIVVCPRRASKSYSAAKKALPIVLGRTTKPDGSGPVPTKTWVVGLTYDLAQIEFQYLWDDLLAVGPSLGWPRPVLSRDSKKSGDMHILTAWGSEVTAKSADKPQSLVGRAVDCMILAESAQLPGEVWTRYLEPCLATTQGYALFPTTPDATAGWLHELWARGIGGDDPDVAAYTWPVTGNPTYPPEEFARQQRFYGLEHPVFREQYLGHWVFYTGTVYGHDFDPTRNLIEPYPIPPDWRRIRALDFGYRDPFCCLWLAITPDSELHVYREYYQSGRAMAEHAAALRALSEGEPMLYTVADPSEQQSIADLRRLGIAALDANNDRRAGRLLVGDALRSGRLKFLRGTCPQTLKELSFYRWDRDKDKEGSKEMTIGDDHAMDALRYAVASRPSPRVALPRVNPQSFVAEVDRRRRDRLLRAWS